MIRAALAPFAPYIMGGLVLAVSAFVWWVMDLRADKARLVAENARLTRELAVQERVAAQAQEARAVADAHARRTRAKADEYDKLREALLKGDDDAPIPAFLCDYLNRLLPGACGGDGAGGAGSPEGAANPG